MRRFRRGSLEMHKLQRAEPLTGSHGRETSDPSRKKSAYPTAYVRESDGEEMVALAEHIYASRSFLERTAGGQVK